jgi:hypothetical protein
MLIASVLLVNQLGSPVKRREYFLEGNYGQMFLHSKGTRHALEDDASIREHSRTV